MPEPFTFGIPLIARSAARDWRRVEALLGLTLASLRAQTDPDFCIVIAGHDRPSGLPADPRLRFLTASWPAGPVRADNLDSGRKKHAICDFVLAQGGGLLMFVDADDWVDTRMIAAARATITPDHVGGFIETGYATDIRGLRAAALPDPRIFPGDFSGSADRAPSPALSLTVAIRCAAIRTRCCTSISAGQKPRASTGLASRGCRSADAT